MLVFNMIRSVYTILFFGWTSIYAQISSIPYYLTSLPTTYDSTPILLKFSNEPQHRPALSSAEMKFVATKIPTSRVITEVPAQLGVSLHNGVNDKDASITHEYRDISFDGTFNYGFDSDNGISVKSKGYLKPAKSRNEGPVQVIEGIYSYSDKNGKTITITYIADDDGFRAYTDGSLQLWQIRQKSH